LKIPKHKKLARKNLSRSIPSGRKCTNCGQPLMMHEGHFFPPCLGDEGFLGEELKKILPRMKELSND